MFTIEKIKKAHSKVKSCEDFPKYIQDIKQLGVHAFETWVIDSHTVYFGADGYQTKSVRCMKIWRLRIIATKKTLAII